jgi:hypothetical protein
MTKDQAIKRILMAISEPARQGTRERTSANIAIMMLEEVIDVLQKQPEYAVVHRSLPKC